MATTKTTQIFNIRSALCTVIIANQLLRAGGAMVYLFSSDLN